MKRKSISRHWLFLTISILGLMIGCNKDKETIVPSSGNPVSFNYSKYYTEIPEVENCNPGKLKEDTKNEVLKYINDIRKIHKLPAILYNHDLDIYTQFAALSTVTNGKQTHYPDAGSYCFNNYVESGSQKSNLYFVRFQGSISDTDNKKAIEGFMHELSNSVEVVGHRRWILDPFLKYISFGRVDGVPIDDKNCFINAFALHVINSENANIEDLNMDFIAYPHNNYPKQLFPSEKCFLSFSVLIDKKSKPNNSNVDYASATVKIYDGTKEIGINSVSFDTRGYGLPNAIQWKINNHKNNTTYLVKIDHVVINGVPKHFEYSFKVN